MYYYVRNVTAPPGVRSRKTKEQGIADVSKISFIMDGQNNNKKIIKHKHSNVNGN